MREKTKGKRPEKMKAKAVIKDSAEIFWEQPPGHSDGAYSKMLVRPENVGAKLLDFRISCYQPKAYVAPHKHKIQEQLFYILAGEGVMEIEGERTVVRPGTIIFLPPGVEHAIYNTGEVDLKFIVNTAPPEDK